MSDSSNDRTIFLGSPGYGKQTAAAGRGLWRACRNTAGVSVEYRQGSLLAANFNGLWCRALNIVHAGERLDYFAMLHDDVGPEDFWLDKLIAEMEARDLDVLGVAIPIKDQKGLTSLAIDNGSTWRPKCRLTMTEVMNLPETFTSEDVGGNLLINTGCWVCRFDPKWVSQVHFTINDRIVFNRTLGIYQAEVEPEDWYFSRLCHELGLKVGATRKIAVTHRGEVDFVNTAPWGTEAFDAGYVTESQLPQSDGPKFPSDVDGWLSFQEGRALSELARGKRVLEIGSYCGRSTICLAQTAEHVTAVDYFDGRATPSPRNTFDDFDANLKRYGVSARVAACTPDGVLLSDDYDLVFIDGAHDYDSVRSDIDKAIAALKPDGLIAFHDYRTSAGQYDGRFDPGVTQAVNELIAAGAELVSTHETLAVVRPPAHILSEVL